MPHTSASAQQKPRPPCEECTYEAQAAKAQQRIGAAIRKMQEKIIEYSKEAASKDNYCLSYRAAGIAEAIALLQAGDP